jgi:8-oxo-dGTP diphosphatase
MKDFNWSAWAPTEMAVLCFVVKGDSLLLIEKLRGLGAGKVNAPGG